MSSPFYTLGICACYIYFVKSLGPRLMRDREPMDLKKTIIAYNFVQVVASIYLIYKVIPSLISKHVPIISSNRLRSPLGLYSEQ